MLSPCFAMQYFVSLLVLQSSHCGRDSWFLYYYHLLDIIWQLLSFCILMDSSFWLKLYNKPGIVHCTYLGMSGFNFQ